MLFFIFIHMIHISNPLDCIKQTNEENKTNENFLNYSVLACKKKKYERSPRDKICISIGGSKIETVLLNLNLPRLGFFRNNRD